MIQVELKPEIGAWLTRKEPIPFKGEGLISADDFAVRVLVIPANEETMIAREMMTVLVKTKAVMDGPVHLLRSKSLVGLDGLALAFNVKVRQFS